MKRLFLLSIAIAFSLLATASEKDPFDFRVRVILVQFLTQVEIKLEGFFSDFLPHEQAILEAAQSLATRKESRTFLSTYQRSLDSELLNKDNSNLRTVSEMSPGALLHAAAQFDRGELLMAAHRALDRKKFEHSKIVRLMNLDEHPEQLAFASLLSLYLDTLEVMPFSESFAFSQAILPIVIQGWAESIARLDQVYYFENPGIGYGSMDEFMENVVVDETDFITSAEVGVLFLDIAIAQAPKSPTVPSVLLQARHLLQEKVNSEVDRVRPKLKHEEPRELRKYLCAKELFYLRTTTGIKPSSLLWGSQIEKRQQRKTF